MSKKISECLDFQYGVQHADITTIRTGPYADVSGAARILGSGQTETVVAATKVLTVQLKQATDSAGAGAKNLGTAVTVTAPTGGSKLKAVQEVHQSDLDEAGGFKFVAVSIVSDHTSACVAGSQLVLGDLRYGPPA